MKPKIQALLVGLLAYVIVSAILLFLSACSTIDREYQFQYDMGTRQCTAGVRLSSGSGERAFSAGVKREIDWYLPNTDIPKIYRDK